MDRRLELQIKLKKLLGSNNVYFQPPASIQLKYPCIVYSRNYGESTFADNGSYLYRTRYSVTIIDKDPDTKLIKKIIEAFQYATYDRHYTADNSNHDVISIYY